MKIQTKCTLVICGLFIIELLPVPFSALYSLYAVRKRPDWLPRVVDELYADKPANQTEAIENLIPEGHDPLTTRKKCTIALVSMFIVDLIIPVIIPTALFVVRRRPLWFKRLSFRLYADKLPSVAQPEVALETNYDDVFVSEEVQQKLASLERENMDFARSLTGKIVSVNP
ncbi:MAG: hypothetical protein ACXWT3_04225 [Methylococcaceae bacterium]